MSEIIRKSYPNVKTTYDLTCVAVAAILTAGVMHNLQGIGVGTVVGALTYGRKPIGDWRQGHLCAIFQAEERPRGQVQPGPPSLCA